MRARHARVHSILGAAALALLACSSTGIVGPTGYEANTTSVSVLAEGTCEPVSGHYLGDDPAFLTLEATALCANRGYVFSAGDGRASSFQCCAPAPVTSATASGTCTELPLGTADSCADSAVWRNAATQVCAGFAASPALFGFRMSDPCGDDRYRYAKVTCCAAGASITAAHPNAGVDICSVGALVGTHGRCIADESATLEGQRTCEEEGLMFSRAITFAGSCQPGTQEGEVIVCCNDTSDKGDDDDEVAPDAGLLTP